MFQFLANNKEYFKGAFVIVAAIPVIGMLIELVTGRIWRLFSRYLGPGFTRVLLKWLTFLGVVHHELSHALLTVLTGAKLKQIVLFKPEKDHLGYVTYGPRGPWVLRKIQNTLISTAPVFCGLFSVYTLGKYLMLHMESLPGLLVFFLWYLIFSIVAHMTMSQQDYQGVWSGMVILYLIVFLVLMMLKIEVNIPVLIRILTQNSHELPM